MKEAPETVHGRLLEAVHLGSYSFERAFGELEWLLADDRWRSVGYADINEFLDSINLSSYRIVAEQRKRIAVRIKELQPEATTRAIGRTLGAGHSSIVRDVGPNGPGNKPKTQQNQQNIGPIGPMTGEEAALVVRRAEESATRKAKKQEIKNQLVIGKFSAEGPFGTVVIDPPWPVEKIDRYTTPNQAEFDYPVMSPEQLLGFWFTELAPRLEKDCHLFMWTTQKWLIPAASDLIPKFGFHYLLTMVWHKPGGFQPFELPQYNCEFIVYARRGAPMFVDTKAFDCCFQAPRREHSRKPDQFYDTIRRVTGGSRIDVFSREPRAGFAQYGNEPEKFK